MSIVEVTTFRLAEGVTDESFLALDRRVQTELVPNQPGFLRRTTARHGEDWLVVTLWSSEDAAAAFQRRPRSIRSRSSSSGPSRPDAAPARYATLD